MNRIPQGTQSEFEAALHDAEFMAWFSGFWEGEGTFSVQYSKRIFRLRITQKEPAPLIEIMERLGGSIYRRPDGNNEWSLSRPDLIRSVIASMLPHLRSRRSFVKARTNQMEDRLKERPYRSVRLNDGLVRELRDFHQNGAKARELALIYGLPRGMVENAVYGETWGTVWP